MVRRHQQPFPERAVCDRGLHPIDRDHLPDTEPVATNGILEGEGCRAAVRRISFTAFIASSISSTTVSRNRYMTGSDAEGLTMGYYHTQICPSTNTCIRKAPRIMLSRTTSSRVRFGGSFLNHQLLIAGTAPVFANAVQDGSSNDLHSILDTNDYGDSHTALYADDFCERRAAHAEMRRGERSGLRRLTL